MRDRYRCAIIGSGPAGLAAAVRLAREGMRDFILIERENELGGILNQCIHTGFGLELYHEDLTGPEFARRLEIELKALLSEADASSKTGPALLTTSMVRETLKESDGSFVLNISSKAEGMLSIKADAVITATGCRERSRENIEIAGSRPAGIYTAGQAQNLINRRHYSPGSSVVIQGSGDIGLIMARRLTIEGFRVLAVFERLPWLSGLIRNKVQCLDHFGIPLHLNRQITDIKGRGRVNAVMTTEINSDGQLVPGSNQEFKCDTVMFAVGLIPELESVKPAGIELADRFHPSVNKLYESNVPGLFACGNCLHINDLADSASVEGTNAAASVLEHLNNPQKFLIESENAGDERPYEEAPQHRELNADFFRRLEDEHYLVCIVCPKGCLIREGEYGCSRGEEYYRRTASPAGGYSQRVSTTVEITPSGESKSIIVPAVSDEEIPVKLISEAVQNLKAKAGEGATGDMISISAGGNRYVFRLCRII